MFQKAFSFCALMVIAVTTVLVAAETSQAGPLDRFRERRSERGNRGMRGDSFSNNNGYYSYNPTTGTYSLVQPNSTDPNTRQSFYPPMDNTVNLTVTVPANAEVLFDGEKTKSTGTVRMYQSPQLRSGEYTYEIKVRWEEDGKERTQTKKITVTPGANLRLTFPLQGEGSISK